MFLLWAKVGSPYPRNIEANGSLAPKMVYAAQQFASFLTMDGHPRLALR